MDRPKSAAPRSRRRWFRFSLRTLMLFTTVIAIGSAWVAKERAQSRREVALARAMKERGEQVRLRGIFDAFDDDPFGDDPFGDDPFGDDPFGDQSPKKQSRWRTLLSQLLGERIVSVYSKGSDLSPFANLSYLEELTAYSAKTSDLTPLAGLKSLDYLDVSGTQVRDLAPLTGLRNLRNLNISGTQVDDLTPLTGLQSLRNVDVRNSRVNAAQVESLKRARPKCRMFEMQ